MTGVLKRAAWRPGTRRGRPRGHGWGGDGAGAVPAGGEKAEDSEQLGPAP